MYEDILKFLKSKNKKLTKEEASEFIKLLAESVGADQDFIINTYISEYSDEENSTDINFAIDTYNDDYSDYEDSFSLEGLSDEDEEDKDYVVLNKRKIVRNTEFKRKKPKESSVEQVKNDCKDFEKLEGDFNLPKKLSFSTTNFLVPNENVDFDISKNVKFELPKFDNKHESCKESIFELPKFDNKHESCKESKFERPKFDNKHESNKESKFELPKFDNKHESNKESNDEFNFDLGELKDVKNTGPDFQFLDENGKEI